MVRNDGKHVGWIYCIEFVGEGKYNGWAYVGQSRQQGGWERRVIQHFNNPSDTFIDNVCQQYDACNFRANLVAEYVKDTEEELIEKLNDCEEYFIHLFGTFVDWGYGFNLAKGGGTKGVSEETRRKLSEKMFKRWMGKGIKVVQCTLEGDIISHYDSISEASKKTGIGASNIKSVLDGAYITSGGYRWFKEEEYDVNNIDDNLVWHNKGEDAWMTKKVMQFDKNGEFIKEWGCIRDAQIEYGKKMHITSCCKGRLNHANGFQWIYSEDYENGTRPKKLNYLNGTKREVYMCDNEMNMLKKFESVSEAAKYVNCNNSQITRCCRGKLNKTHGYKWVYADS